MKAVIWDLDGTLIDSEPVHFDLVRDICERHGVEMSDDQYQRFVGLPARDIFTTIVAEHALSAAPAELVNEKYALYASCRDRLQANRPALQAWRQLEARGVPQAIVSNADRMIAQINIEALGLSRPGLIAVCRNDVRAGKPDPEGYLRAAYLLGLPPGRCIANEDSPLGARAALAAGMEVVVWPGTSDDGFPPGCHPGGAADLAKRLVRS